MRFFAVFLVFALSIFSYSNRAEAQTLVVDRTVRWKSGASKNRVAQGTLSILSQPKNSTYFDTDLFRIEFQFTAPSGKKQIRYAYYVTPYEVTCVDTPNWNPNLDSYSGSNQSPLLNGDPYKNPHTSHFHSLWKPSQYLASKNSKPSEFQIRFVPEESGAYYYTSRMIRPGTIPEELSSGTVHVSHSDKNNALEIRKGGLPYLVDSLGNFTPVLGVNYDLNETSYFEVGLNEMTKSLIRLLKDNEKTNDQIREALPVAAPALTNPVLEGLRKIYSLPSLYDNRNEAFTAITKSVFWNKRYDYSPCNYKNDLGKLSENGVNGLRIFSDNLETTLGQYDQWLAHRFDLIYEFGDQYNFHIQNLVLLAGEFEYTDFWRNRGSYNPTNGNPYSSAHNPPGPIDSRYPETFFQNETAREYFKKRLVYLWSRYPHVSNTILDIGGEINRVLKTDSQIAYADPNVPNQNTAYRHACNSEQDPCGIVAWHEEMAKFTKSLFGGKRLVTTGLTDAFPTDPSYVIDLFSQPSIDITQINRYSYFRPTFVDPSPVSGQVGFRSQLSSQIDLATTAAGESVSPFDILLNGIRKTIRGPHFDYYGDYAHVLFRKAEQFLAVIPKPFMIGEAGRFDPDEFSQYDPNHIAQHHALWASSLSGMIGNAQTFYFQNMIRVQGFAKHFKPLSGYLKSAINQLKSVGGDQTTFRAGRFGADLGRSADGAFHLDSWLGSDYYSGFQGYFLTSTKHQLGYVIDKRFHLESLYLASKDVRDRWQLPVSSGLPDSNRTLDFIRSMRSEDAPAVAPRVSTIRFVSDLENGSYCVDWFKTDIDSGSLDRSFAKTTMIITPETSGMGEIILPNQLSRYGDLAYYVYPNPSPCAQGGILVDGRCVLRRDVFDKPLQVKSDGFYVGDQKVQNLKIGQEGLVRQSPIWYVSPKGRKKSCPKGAVFDGANCVLGRGAPGSTAFIIKRGSFWKRKKHLYFTPGVGAEKCVAPAQFDGVNCYLGQAPKKYKVFSLMESELGAKPSPCVDVQMIGHQ